MYDYKCENCGIKFCSALPTKASIVFLSGKNFYYCSTKCEEKAFEKYKVKPRPRETDLEIILQTIHFNFNQMNEKIDKLNKKLDDMDKRLSRIEFSPYPLGGTQFTEILKEEKESGMINEN